MKCWLESQVLRDNTLTIHNANDIVQLWNKFGSKETKAYTFCHLEEMAPFTRESKDDRPFIRITNIMKMHEVTFVGGGLVAKEVSCHDCAITSGICESCQESQCFTVKPEKVQRALAGWVDPDVSEEEQPAPDVENLDYDEDVLEQSDGELDSGVVDSDDDESDDDEGNGMKVGSIVWALRYGRRVPAKIVCIEDVPMPRQKTLRTKKANVSHVEYLGLNKYGNSEVNKLVPLGNSPQDHIWGEGNVNFLMALSQI